MKKLLLFLLLACTFAAPALAAHLTIKPDTVTSPISAGTIEICLRGFPDGAIVHVCGPVVAPTISATCYMTTIAKGPDCIVIPSAGTAYKLDSGEYPIATRIFRKLGDGTIDPIGEDGPSSTLTVE